MFMTFLRSCKLLEIERILYKGIFYTNYELKNQRSIYP